MSTVRFPVLLALAASLLTADPASARWPLVWDHDSRSDRPVAARLADDGDLFVLVQSFSQGVASPGAVLLRLSPVGMIRWTATDPLLHVPTGLALRPDGGALIVGRSGPSARFSAIAPEGGAPQWSRTRRDVTWTDPMFGLPAQPIWSPADATWRAPLRKSDEFAIVGYDVSGTPLPDWSWSPPNGAGGATGVLPRSGGGWWVTGSYDGGQDPPGWWTLATDSAGAELWSRFESGDAPAGIFSGAFFVDAPSDQVVAWAIDETACGVFSLRLWSLDSHNGNLGWATTWPPPGDCSSFTPSEVLASGGRLLSSGLAEDGSTGQSGVVSLDPKTGTVVWDRSFAGATTPLATGMTSAAGSALVANALFPPVNPGPAPLWTTAWDRDGSICGPPQQHLPARVHSSLRGIGGRWYLIGSVFLPQTANDLVIQTVHDPCATLFVGDFETGDLTPWSQATP